MSAGEWIEWLMRTTSDALELGGARRISISSTHPFIDSSILAAGCLLARFIDSSMLAAGNLLAGWLAGWLAGCWLGG